MAQSNIMDFSTSSNAMIQDNSEGLIKRMLSTSRERVMGVETLKKNKCLITWVDGDMIGDADFK